MLDSMHTALVKTLIQSGGVVIRDVDNGEEPFLYSSGNYGPGYIDVKGRCAFPTWVETCATVLATKMVNCNAIPHVITGNATGGMIASWALNRKLSHLIGKELPYFYLRGTRKVGGHRELVTGEKLILKPGLVATVGEELINYAGTTTEAARYLRDRHRLIVRYGTSFLNYDHAATRVALEAAGVEAIYLFTLSDVLDVGVKEGLLKSGPVEKYREFLANPSGWMNARGLTKKEMA